MGEIRYEGEFYYNNPVTIHNDMQPLYCSKLTWPKNTSKQGQKATNTLGNSLQTP